MYKAFFRPSRETLKRIVVMKSAFGKLIRQQEQQRFMLSEWRHFLSESQTTNVIRVICIFLNWRKVWQAIDRTFANLLCTYLLSRKFMKCSSLAVFWLTFVLTKVETKRKNWKLVLTYLLLITNQDCRSTFARQKKK